MSFGENLKRTREEKGWSQRKLAAISGVSRITIVAYENNKRTPNVYNAVDLALALEVSVEELVGVSQ